MQVYSIKVAEREGFALEWPLKGYGVVAARVVFDYRRNLLFLRTRDECQILTSEVCMGIFPVLSLIVCIFVYMLMVNNDACSILSCT